MQIPIILDWDNTIIDTMDSIIEAFNFTLQTFGRSPVDRKWIKSHNHRSTKDIFPLLFGEYSNEATKIYIDKYDDLCTELRVLPNALDTITLLEEDPRVFLVVISNKQGPLLRKEIEILNLTHKFKRITGSKDAKYDKPNPEVAFYTFQDTKFDLSNALVIGDSCSDIELAANLNCKSILLNTDDILVNCSPAKATYIAISHQEIQKIIFNDFLEYPR